MLLRQDPGMFWLTSDKVESQNPAIREHHGPLGQSQMAFNTRCKNNLLTIIVVTDPEGAIRRAPARED